LISVRARASARHFLVHPWQFGLAALGITFGVALAVGMDVASASVRRAFSLGAEAASGRATHEIVGGPRGVPEGLYRRLRVELGIRELAPFVGGALALADRPGQVIQLVGVDPFAEAPFRPALAWNAPAAEPALAALLIRPGAALVSARTAQRLGLQPGTPLIVRVGAQRRSLSVAAVWQEPGETERRALDGVVVVDLATAQELLGQTGWLTRIDIRDDPTERSATAGADVLARIAAALPAGLRLEPVAARTGALLAMTRAFDLNLRALSLLALLVGAFLIYNTQTFSVVQRRALLGTLRTLGVTRAQVVAQVLAEALVLGVVGTAAGMLLGVGLGRGLVRLVSRAVSDLYFVVSVREVAIPPGVLLRGALLGVAAAVLSSLPAAREAARAEPRLALLRSALEQRTRRRLPATAVLAVLMAVAATLLLRLSGQSLPLALLALLMVLLAGALAAPLATVGLAGLAGRILGRLQGLTGRMAARGVGRTLSRTGVAIAALMVALSVTVGVSVMVGSFRTAVEEWLSQTLRADVYVTAAPLVAARNEARLPRELAERLRALPGVVAVGTARGITVLAADGERVLVTVLESAWPRGGPRLLEGDPPAALRAFQQGDAVLVTEPFAYKRRLHPGDRVVLLAPAGPRSFEVAGVVRDYSSDAGVVLMSRRAYDRNFDDPYLSSVALYAGPGVSVDALVDRARAVARPGEELFVRSNRALRQTTLAVFDHTFEVTAVLRLLALLVAAFGVMSALMALELERTRELGVLRALGFTAGQVARLVAMETALLGLLAGVLAVPVGGALAAVLVFVINRRSFGWTMDLVLAPGALALAPLLGLVAGLLGGLYPATRMARISPAEALRDE
jgi:putative ABC transport system permease protein